MQFSKHRVLKCFLEYRTVNKVEKASNPKCNTVNTVEYYRLKD
jgi:hypothetical protein